VIANYSQIELRVVAEISQDERMIDAYQKGEDLHRLTADLVTGECIADDSKNINSFCKSGKLRTHLCDGSRRTRGIFSQ
jgi:hypothetical protein